MIECIPTEEQHTTGSACACLPEVIFENGEMIVIHNAFDGRQTIEQVNEILGNEPKQNQWEIIIH